jgi:uncharacterized protein DUF1828
MKTLLENIKKSFNNKIDYMQKRPGIYQLFIPTFHEDGDMVDLFISMDKGKIILSDFGMTLQKLSYSYEIDTPNKNKIFNRILSENFLEINDGNIFFETKESSIFSDILHVIQAYMKIGSMTYFKREVIESLFYEILEEIVHTDLKEFNPRSNVKPLSRRDDLEVDFEFRPNGYPVYLFGVKDNYKASSATISCLEFQKAKLDFRSFIVLEDLENLSKKDQIRLLSASDKLFPNLDDFKFNAKSFLEREKH